MTDILADVRRLKHRLMRLASWLPESWVNERATRESVESDVLDGPAFWFDASYWQFCRKDKRKKAKVIKLFERLGHTPAPDENEHEFYCRAMDALFPEGAHINEEST